jgi:uncharacterized protein (DUF1778 family)
VSEKPIHEWTQAMATRKIGSHFRLTPEARESIDKASEALGVDKTQFVERAVTEYAEIVDSPFVQECLKLDPETVKQHLVDMGEFYEWCQLHRKDSLGIYLAIKIEAMERKLRNDPSYRLWSEQGELLNEARVIREMENEHAEQGS